MKKFVPPTGPFVHQSCCITFLQRRVVSKFVCEMLLGSGGLEGGVVGGGAP